MRTDVLVVGAGPTGSFVAKSLAERGFGVTIVEEHAQIGQPVRCAGVVGVSGMRELGLGLDDIALAELTRAIFYPPRGKPVELTRGKVEARVIDRGAFDRGLADRAVEAGAALFTRTKCADLKFGREVSATLRGDHRKELKARLVIGADGPSSLVARKAGLIEAPEYIKCAQVETRAEVDANTAELYFGRDLVPGLFVWMVPAGELCRVGLGTTVGDPAQRLSSFINHHPVALNRVMGKALHFAAGLIPTRPPKKIYSDRVLLVGDAACHVKPLTGGGIYVGLSCARFAAEAAAKALETEPTARNLRTYERGVAKKFGLEFELGMRARRLFQRLTDEELTSAFGLLEKPGIKALVLKHADFDHHAELLRALMKRSPALLRALGWRWLIKYARSLS